MSGQIRPIAVGVVRRGAEILVFDAIDSVDGKRFHRPLGGGIEFGERAADAVARELHEETGYEVIVDGLLGVVENVFTHEGREHHELCFVFDVHFEDETANQRESFAIVELVRGEAIRLPASWVDPERLEAPLYPDGLVALLANP